MLQVSLFWGPHFPNLLAETSLCQGGIAYCGSASFESCSLRSWFIISFCHRPNLHKIDLWVEVSLIVLSTCPKCSSQNFIDVFYLTEASTFEIIWILTLNIIKLTVKIESEEITEKCHPKTLNLLCCDSFEMIEITFKEATFLFQKTPKRIF